MTDWHWRGGDKPHDAGTGVVCASFAASGAWLSLGAVDPRDGFVELSGMPAFDERKRGRPEQVRRYRALMANERSAFLSFAGVPAAVLRSAVVRAEPGSARISQDLRFEAADGPAQPRSLRLRFAGRLDRPALAMITEADHSLPTAPATTRLDGRGRRLHVTAQGLACVAHIEVRGEPAGSWHVSGDKAELELAWPTGAHELAITVECSLAVEEIGHRVAPSRLPPPARSGPLSVAQLAVARDLRQPLSRMRQRALTYARECTALRVAAGRVCILTDHRLLPLSWTRDAYYQAVLLLGVGETRLVADHLRWLWLACDRPQATWARSHHADGRPHDHIYQADQQLYPLLELADFWHATGELPTLDGEASWHALVGSVLDDLLQRMEQTGFLPTQQNAADDPVAMPFLLADQVLAAHVFERLAPAGHELRVRHDLPTIAGDLRTRSRRQFDAGDRLWAYAVDLEGRALLYHDANDLPTAFAPLLGFCATDDPRWRRTMAFAFSPANEAFVAGEFGGLGSRHTAGVWPLGLIQEWVARSLMGEGQAADAALRRLVACGLSDGSLPEAADPVNARLTARHWFAWPGALLGALLAGSLGAD